MKMNKLRLSIIILAIGLTAYGAVYTSGLLSTRKTLENTGTINAAIGIGIYSDSACTLPLTKITWVTLDPGTATTNTIYVKNIGHTPVRLTLTIDNWMPSEASNYITVTWNREGASLEPSSVVASTIQLSLSQSVQGIQSYSFNINIDATG